MIRSHTEEQTQTVTINDALVCNKCGCTVPADAEGRLSSNEEFGSGVSVKYGGGYHSSIGDGISFDFDLCDRCLWEFVLTFKHRPQMRRAAWLGGGILDDDGNVIQDGPSPEDEEDPTPEDSPALEVSQPPEDSQPPVDSQPPEDHRSPEDRQSPEDSPPPVDSHE
jgi:hypothetical protein